MHRVAVCYCQLVPLLSSIGRADLMEGSLALEWITAGCRSCLCCFNRNGTPVKHFVRQHLVERESRMICRSFLSRFSRTAALCDSRLRFPVTVPWLLSASNLAQWPCLTVIVDDLRIPRRELRYGYVTAPDVSLAAELSVVLSPPSSLCCS